MKKSHFPKAKLAFSPLRMNREHKKVSMRGLGWPSFWGSEEPGNGRLDNAQSKRPPGSSLLPRWRAHLDRRLVSKYPKQSGGCVSFLLISGSSIQFMVLWLVSALPWVLGTEMVDTEIDPIWERGQNSGQKRALVAFGQRVCGCSEKQVSHWA